MSHAQLAPIATTTYRPTQRAVALVFGLACHGLFALAVVTMAASFYSGMTLGRGPFHGRAAVLFNLVLLLQFPLWHSWLLSPRGRGLLPRLAPLGIGKELSTTVFAIISSLQLIATFLLWAPSGVVWWQPHGAQRALMFAPYAGAWLFLMKAMSDSHLSLQTGYLGWGAVFRNRRPEFRTFATRGLYRHTRQPIYLAFSLILWTGSTWTPDQLVIAAVWTLYCVAGAALKERRLMQRHGHAYADYRARVPFWLPAIRPR